VKSNCPAIVAVLTDDYLKHSGKFVHVFENRSMEAQAVLSRG
jgi:hypothetical protein